MKVLIAGDYCDKLRISEAIKARDYGMMFDEVKPILDETDYSIVNFEFSIVRNRCNPIPKCGPNLSGHKLSIDAIKYAGFKCCTLANNHILDFGQESGLETMKLLELSGIDTVGFGCNEIEASKILYKQINGETLAIINCCEHEFSIADEKKAGANPLNPIQQYYCITEAKKNSDFVLVIIHGGHEMHQLPSPRMKESYRFFVDIGADVVINHHQHCYSGFEIYNGKPIFYGLGNFLFDSKLYRNEIWNKGYMVELLFDKKRGIEYKIIPYNQCNATATVTLLKGSDYTDFLKNVESLSAIITDDQKLREATYRYYSSCIKEELLILEPYGSKISRKLFSLGLLPRFVTYSKSLSILNHTSCESHRDKLVYALKHIKTK